MKQDNETLLKLIKYMVKEQNWNDMDAVKAIGDASGMTDDDQRELWSQYINMPQGVLLK